MHPQTDWVDSLRWSSWMVIIMNQPLTVEAMPPSVIVIIIIMRIKIMNVIAHLHYAARCWIRKDRPVVVGRNVVP